MTMRRKLGKAILGLAITLPLVWGAQAQAQDNVSLRLNWYIGGLHVPFYFGGTSLLIIVGVVLDTLQQIESHLLMRHYDGLMKSGKVRGRSASAVSMAG